MNKCFRMRHTFKRKSYKFLVFVHLLVPKKKCLRKQRAKTNSPVNTVISAKLKNNPIYFQYTTSAKLQRGMISWPMCSSHTFYRSMIPSKRECEYHPVFFGIHSKYVCWRHPNTLSTLRSIHGSELNSVRINGHVYTFCYESVILMCFCFVYYIMFRCMGACVCVCVYDERKYELRDLFFSLYLFVFYPHSAGTNWFHIRRMLHNWAINEITRFFDYQFPQMYSKYVWLKQSHSSTIEIV